MKKTRLLVGIVIVALLFSNGYLFYEVNQLKNSEVVGTNTNTTVEKVVTDFNTDITKLVEETENKAVGITTLKNMQAVSTGSGAVYEVNDNKVLIVTNAHVVEDGDSFQVTFSNSKEFEAKLLGKDTITDLALLEVTVDFEQEAFKIGDSSLSKVGEFIIAIGSPLGLEFQGTTTFGIISGVDRVVEVDTNSDNVADWDMSVIQIDAAINPGNSGGPLINLAGELIGINSMKISSSSVEGIGFAIPINEVIPIIEQLKENGSVNRPILGISSIPISYLNDYEKNLYGISNIDDGLLISKVEENSSAAKAGIKAKDILIEFDGQEITDFKEFRKILYSKNVGDEVKAVVIRDGKKVEVNIKL